ncbi:hypothetical protein LIER_11326 [Lithospermum erythrorhizon]|uniref:SHSP domain-containing protein n=1 Tax=Lithospermum erythrorhizon TaxID=34254 RepID=A0AAV3PMY7_LITER
MSHCLSNATLLSQPSSVYQSISLNPRFSQLFYPSYINCRSHGKNKIKAMATQDGRVNLDHLQRAGNSQPKKKLSQAAPIGLWDRFPTAGTVQQMMETMDRLMEDPFAYSRQWSSSPENTPTSLYSRGRTPWEIKEGEKDYKMRFDMPGMTKEDVKVWVEENMLVIKAEKEPKKKGDIEGGEIGDWGGKSYGRYSYRIALPENVEFEKIKAEVKDGVLYITIPKVVEVASTKILDINVQ